MENIAFKIGHALTKNQWATREERLHEMNNLRVIHLQIEMDCRERGNITGATYHKIAAKYYKEEAAKQ
jgi:hypothetical protein